LDLDLSVATARIYKDVTANSTRTGVEGGDQTLSSVAHSVEDRMCDEQERFLKLYGVDPYDQSQFDLIIDTARHNPHSVAIAVFDAYKQWLQMEYWKQRKSAIPLGFSYKNQY
jgi:cytidylate kinase